MLSDEEKLTLNHIRAHDYLSIFGLVEEFILPFLMDHVRPSLPDADDVRVRAMMQFAAEEAKHIQLFKRFHETFTKGFGQECEVIGPPEAVAKVVLAHDPLSVAMTILMIEWMTQSHYVESVRGDTRLEPSFVNLLRCHWMEEAQHAKLDTLMVQDMAKDMSQQQFKQAIDGFLEIGSVPRHRPQAAGAVQPRRAGAQDEAPAARAGTQRAAGAAAPGAALDLPRFRPSPRQVPRHDRRNFTGTAAAHRHDRAELLLNNTKELQGE